MKYGGEQDQWEQTHKHTHTHINHFLIRSGPGRKIYGHIVNISVREMYVIIIKAKGRRDEIRIYARIAWEPAILGAKTESTCFTHGQR